MSRLLLHAMFDAALVAGQSAPLFSDVPGDSRVERAETKFIATPQLAFAGLGRIDATPDDTDGIGRSRMRR